MIDSDEVYNILTNEWKFLDWQVQGFGMLRTYLDGPGEPRLQIWDQRLAEWGNGAIHDHPWHFKSRVIAGILFNQRYTRTSGIDRSWAKYQAVKLTPGIGGGRHDEDPVEIWLSKNPVEVLSAGEEYSQRADELHLTRYLPGTVTIIERTRTPEMSDTATSIWPDDSDVPWIFFEPRPAGAGEVKTVVESCLRTWWM